MLGSTDGGDPMAYAAHEYETASAARRMAIVNKDVMIVEVANRALAAIRKGQLMRQSTYADMLTLRAFVAA